uniref:Plastocyanin-like domain-containing protein n=1 Tax=Oryza barthii TaxID=65489 RepID=A0A0D3ELY2_9ORYZ
MIAVEAAQHTVLLNDWWHRSTYEQAAGLASVPIVWVGEPQSLLINGRSRFMNCSSSPATVAASCNMAHPYCAPAVFAVRHLPLRGPFALVGLIDMFNAGDAIEECAIDATAAVVPPRVCGCGRFGAYFSWRPARCTLDGADVGFTYDSDTRRTCSQWGPHWINLSQGQTGL